jgi:Flp pilus assembly protein TadG
MSRPDSRREHGQALVEMALVVVLFVSLALGIVEFGRAWMISNMIMHAARNGGRIAATSPSRTGGTITDTAAIKTEVLNQIKTVVPTTGFEVNVTQPPPEETSGIPMVQVQVTGNVPYLFHLVPGMTSFPVNRTVTFRDEGR